MAMTLKPELEQRIHRLVAHGYVDAEQVIESALNLLEPASGGMSAPEIRTLLEERWAAAERGETISDEEHEAAMDAWREKMYARL